MNEKINQLVAQVAALRGSKFASLTYTKSAKVNGAGEQARHTIILGFDYMGAVKRSLAELQARKFDSELDKQAAAELVASFEKTIAAHEAGERNPDYTKKDVYVSLFNGLNVSKTDGSFKLFGLSISKKVLVNGVYRTVNSKPLTVAKDAIRKTLTIGAFREFAVSEESLANAKLNGETIEF